MQNPMTKKVSTFGHSAAEDSEEEIRPRAYELYEARSRGDGHDLEDWLEAEILTSEYTSPEASGLFL